MNTLRLNNIEHKTPNNYFLLPAKLCSVNEQQANNNTIAYTTPSHSLNFQYYLENDSNKNDVQGELNETVENIATVSNNSQELQQALFDAGVLCIYDVLAVME